MQCGKLCTKSRSSVTSREAGGSCSDDNFKRNSSKKYLQLVSSQRSLFAECWKSGFRSLACVSCVANNAPATGELISFSQTRDKCCILQNSRCIGFCSTHVGNYFVAFQLFPFQLVLFCYFGKSSKRQSTMTEKEKLTAKQETTPELTSIYATKKLTNVLPSFHKDAKKYRNQTTTL